MSEWSWEGYETSDVIRQALEIDREVWEERGEMVPVEERVRSHSMEGRIEAADVDSGFAYEYEVQDGETQDRTEKDGETTVFVLGTARRYGYMSREARRELDAVLVGGNPDAPFGERLDREPRAWLVSTTDL